MRKRILFSALWALLPALAASPAIAGPQDTLVAPSDTALADTAMTDLHDALPAASPADSAHTAADAIAAETDGDSLTENRFFVVKETRDTVFVIRTGDAGELAEDSRKAARKITEKGFGLAGVVLQGVHAIKIEPAMDLAASIRPGLRWDINSFAYEPFFLSGGMGYVGVGNGVRLGGGGMHGNRSFVSAPFSGDSVASLTVDVNFGGFLIEKALRVNNSTMIGGGYIGGGALKAEMGIGEFLEEDVDMGSFEARFLYTELHGAYTYSILPILHLGLGASVPLFFSSDGFVPYNAGSGFVSVNPGLHLRIVIGNLG
jgi:hypothetical protein